VKSIRSRITLIVLAIIVFLSITFGIANSILTVKVSNATLQKSMMETADMTADRIHQEVKGYANAAVDAGYNSVLADDAVAVAQKKSILDRQVSAYGFESGDVLGTNGASLFTGTSYADQEYFKTALQGKTYISGLAGENSSVVIAAPLWAGGVSGSTVKGAVCFTMPKALLNKIASSINVGDSGSAYLIDKNGTNLGGNDISVTDALKKKMTGGETGSESFQSGKTPIILSYAPVPDTNGWSVGIAVPQSEFNQAGRTALIVIALIALIFIVIGFFLSLRLGNAIAKPIHLCCERLEGLAKGDLKTPVPEINTNDEIAVLADSTKAIVGEMNKFVGDQIYLLNELSHWNFNIDTKGRTYEGDFAPIIESLEKIISSMNRTLVQINQASSQVATEADQVSNGAQALSQGATEQASAIEELAAGINQISDKVKENALNAVQAGEWTTMTVEQVTNCNDLMHKMVNAMNKIEETSGQISKIVKTIEDIAFQTNILALNAAVEASRAGSAGRGFAVVADEVRNLASKSATSAKDTSTLIADSLKAVADGSKMANSTLESLQKVVKSIKETQREHGEIADVTKDQEKAVGELTASADQISSVVQTNTATAQQSAVASEELSSQAQMLRSLVSQFKLRETQEPGKAIPARAEPQMAAKAG